MQNSLNAILDQPIPRPLRRGLSAPLIRTATKRELKRLQKQSKINVVTRRVNKAFNNNLTDYQLLSGDRDVQDSEIFFSDLRPYIKQIVNRKLKRFRPTNAGVAVDL